MFMKILKLNAFAVLSRAAESIYGIIDLYETNRRGYRKMLLILLSSALVVTVLVNIGDKVEAAKQAELDMIAERTEAMLNTEPVPETVPQEYIDEAELLARVIYGIRRNSENDMRTHIWCIFNRIDTKTGEFSKTNTLEEAVNKPGQWIFFEPDYEYPVVESLYQIALEEVKKWHEEHRPCAPDFVYEEWSEDEIVLRTTWEYEKHTKTWRYEE